MIKLVILDGDNDGTTCTVFHLQIENEMEFLFLSRFSAAYSFSFVFLLPHLAVERNENE